MAYIGYPQSSWTQFSYPVQTGSPPQPFAPTPGFFGRQNPFPMQLMTQLLQALTFMAQGWQSMAGAPQYGSRFPTQQQGGQALSLPTDSQDFASYLQAQRIGGTLQGKTGIAQKDAIPGTRFGRLQDSHLWDVDVARNYAFQFAAYASDNDALSAQGMYAGAQAFQNMKPDAKLFMQVASVFKGDINGGPGFYDNPGLRRLLESKGQFDLIKEGVGETDVQTIGAVTKAINRGVLSLNDILNSGTIDNMPRYGQIIDYVSSGGFQRDVNRYDNTPF